MIIAVYIAVLSTLVYGRGYLLAKATYGRYLFTSFVFDVVALGLIIVLLHLFNYAVKNAVVRIIGHRNKWHKLLANLTHITVVLVVVGPFLITTLQFHPQRISCRGTPKDTGLKNYSDVTFYSGGIRLSGWFIPAEQNNKPVILVTHGLGANKENFLYPVSIVQELGYNAFIFDFRAHGDSGGYLTTFGIKEAQDIKAAYDWIAQTYPGQPIYVLSYSMGGAAVIKAAVEYGIFDKIVIDSSFAHFENVAKAKVLKNFGPLATPMWQLGRFWGWVWTGVDIADNQPEKLMPLLEKRRIMIIHGTKDSFIPYTESVRLYEATGRRAELWLVDNADHVQSMTHPEYKTRLHDFYKED